ncbi:hypothetical protein JTY60_01560 [symbiont of Argiope bruennichi]|uniref:hypothetical protein n=1 Tax=symbiont of Argiope bruennichi TaxID=2810479 RepID=UPI003DA69E6A
MNKKHLNYYYLTFDLSLNKNAAILFKNNKIINLFFIDLKNQPTLIDKSFYLTKYFKTIFEFIKNEKIVVIVEKPFISWFKNKNVKTTYDLIFLQGWISNFFKNYFTKLILLKFVFPHVWKHELFGFNVSCKKEIINYVNKNFSKNYKNSDICDAFCIYQYYQKKFLY